VGLRFCHDPSAAHAACSGRDDSWFRVRLLVGEEGRKSGHRRVGGGLRASGILIGLTSLPRSLRCEPLKARLSGRDDSLVLGGNTGNQEGHTF
jgi:hypothetical protein